MKSCVLIYPHQLFKKHPAIKSTTSVFFVEDPLYFSQYAFHKQKIIFHRASMSAYAAFLKNAGHDVEYIEAHSLQDSEQIGHILVKKGFNHIYIADVVDDWLSAKLTSLCTKHNITLTWVDTPSFFLNQQEIQLHFSSHATLNMANFYKYMRLHFNILIADGKPVGGKWSLDHENRKKCPKDLELPSIPPENNNTYVQTAKQYVSQYYPKNTGNDSQFIYPVTHEEAENWLDTFLIQRLSLFGPYEDAINRNHLHMFHSMLSPLLNAGLLTPQLIIKKALHHAQEHAIPLQSLEGFIRQVLGWREFIRGAYISIGRKERSKNFWKADRKLPQSFWTASTGIEPIDSTITKILKYGYAHHIERLMILSNFMLLCEFNPHNIYEWFMEMFIDAYDWVMVPNVYGMGLFADGGMISTKPYISTSNYILKMSNFERGAWCDIWDGLFWRFMQKHRTYFEHNARLNFLTAHLDGKNSIKIQQLIITAEKFLEHL